MWRDLERICDAQDLPLKTPPHRFPQNGLKAARIALALASKGRIGEFTRAVYTANFAEQRDIADDSTLAGILTRMGCDATAITEAANTPENKQALKQQTDDAIARGIFGAPSFTVGSELFWGSDRLEQALAWARTGSP
jgi:2-hydroxychromene-2-carboxylate isomerase